LSYAGFWLRFVASLIDGIILMIVFAILYSVLGEAASLPGALICWLYFALMESSEKQATFGKLALGLRVTNLEGERIGFGRATGRYFGKIVSQAILYIGYIMAGFTERKQGLHDMMASCLVVRGTNETAATYAPPGDND
jgi:uncharacterized RDD family membrane protein YckC